MDFDAVAQELYRLDPQEFVPARTAAIAEARTTRDRPLATRLGALKKPTRSAWLVNLLAGSDAGGLGALKELAARVARAHGSADLAALRAVGAERQRVVDGLTRQALTAGQDHGYTATEAVRLEVHGTLSSALADAEVLADVLAGRVVKAQVYSGFGFPLAAAPAQPMATAAAVEPPVAEAADDTSKRREQAERAVATTTNHLIDARAALRSAEQAQAAQAEALDRAGQEVADLRAELRRAEQAEEGARRASGLAADELHDARGAVQQAEQSLAEAARVLGSLD